MVFSVIGVTIHVLLVDVLGDLFAAVIRNRHEHMGGALA